jgi:hypothetical protein
VPALTSSAKRRVVATEDVGSPPSPTAPSRCAQATVTVPGLVETPGDEINPKDRPEYWSNGAIGLRVFSATGASKLQEMIFRPWLNTWTWFGPGRRPIGPRDESANAL